jgi:hypothetical protein
VGVGAAALTLAAFAMAAARGAPAAVTGLLAAAAGLSPLHSAATGRAAPTMFQIGNRRGFLTAARNGDFVALLEALDPDVVVPPTAPRRSAVRRRWPDARSLACGSPRSPCPR